MWPLFAAMIDEDGPNDERGRRLGSKLVRFAATTLVAGAVLTFSFFPSRILGAGTAPHASSKNRAPSVAGSSGLVAESREQLKKLLDEILGVGTSVVNAREAVAGQNIDPNNQQIIVRSASAIYENAKLTREIAEIAVVEYEQGIYKQYLATAMGELKLAESDLSKAQAAIDLTTKRLAQIRQVSKSSSSQELANEYLYEDRLAESELREPRARLAVEKAKLKLTLLREYTRPKRLKELHAEVERTRADELAKQARWELEKSKLKKLVELANGQDSQRHDQRVLALLDRAIPLAEQLRIKLEQAPKDRERGDTFRKELADSIAQLQAVVDEAQGENAAAKWAKLKPRVHAAAIRYLGAPAK